MSQQESHYSHQREEIDTATVTSVAVETSQGQEAAKYLPGGVYARDAGLLVFALTGHRTEHVGQIELVEKIVAVGLSEQAFFCPKRVLLNR